MGNAIRWLKDVIIKVDPTMPEHEAKRDLLEEIDIFIRERVTAANRLIRDHAATKIEPGDVILTYAASSIVEQTLIYAHESKKIPFSVIVVNSKPLDEGKHLARKLARRGIKVGCYEMNGVTHAVKNATKVFLGAHAMLQNGRLYSRIGTASVAMLAHAQSLPIDVLCQSVKFSDKAPLDSIMINEVAPSDELLSETQRRELLPLQSLLTSQQKGTAPSDGPKAAATEEAPAKTTDVPSWIAQTKNLHHLQLLYDVTPAHYINMVITEYGSLPPSSVPVVHRLSTNA